MPTFEKKERLCNRTLTDHLFQSGKQIKAHPFMLLWDECVIPGNVAMQIMVTVSKKRFPHAVDRNAIKRKMREAVRLHKSELLQVLAGQKKQCAVCLMYTGKGIETYSQMESKILLILRRLQKHYEQTAD
jgi:ribonuclease P protein component